MIPTHCRHCGGEIPDPEDHKVYCNEVCANNYLLEHKAIRVRLVSRTITRTPVVKAQFHLKLIDLANKRNEDAGFVQQLLFKHFGTFDVKSINETKYNFFKKIIEGNL